MQKNRVKARHLVQDHVPNFVRDNYPEFQEFLRTYYKSVESPGGPTDILNNIDQYVRLENLSELVYFTDTTSGIGLFNDTITVSDTTGFPEKHGLIQIDSEVISYESKTATTFVGCERGFSGITSYKGETDDSLTFSQTEVSEHVSGSVTYNLHALFLFEFYRKYKAQYTPGFEDVTFFESINEKIIVSRLKDFYAAKGASSSFDILFKIIFGVDISVVKPRDFLIQPSDADYRIVRDLVVEPLVGDPNDLINRTLFQDETASIQKATGSITAVEQLIKDNQLYYRLSLDYNPDIELFKFTVHPKTRLTEAVSLGQDYIDVDSTVSFPASGTLQVKVDGIIYDIPYTSKSSTQFFGLVASVAIENSVDITTPDYAYAVDNDENDIRVKITGVLGDLVYDAQASNYYSPGDQVEIVSLGYDSQEQLYKSWILNITPEYDVQEMVKLTNNINGAAQYRVTTFDPHVFTLGDIGTLTSSSGQIYDVSILAVSDETIFDVNLPANINLSETFVIRRGISKVSATNLPDLTKVSANMQNVYSTLNNQGGRDAYVVSSSLPDYFNTPIVPKDQSVLFSGSFNGFELNIGSNPFYSGDAVWYSANNNIPLDIPEGQYFVKKVNASTINLATSKSNIANGIFVRVFGTVSNNKFELIDFYNKSIKPQNIVRKFSKPEVSDSSEVTTPGQTGMFLNGVEVLNYKSSDLVYYGKLEGINVSADGDSNYDVINPPILHIEDSVGTGATGVCNLNGSLKRIDIIEKGFDYVTDPTVTIFGGEGNGAEAKCNLSKVTHKIYFNAASQYTDVNLTDNTIGFSTYHKLRDQEEVIYKNEGQTAIGGLVDKSIYFANMIDERTIKLHNTYEDAISGIGTVDLTSNGEGLQFIEAYNKKSIVSSIEVVDGGSGYQNKTLYFDPLQVNINNNCLELKDHGYKDKETVIFINEGGSFPVGVASTTQWMVKVLDKDKIRLARKVNVGTGESVGSDYFYVNNRFFDFTDQGTGNHKLTYTPITVTVDGPIGVSTVAGQDFRTKIRPLFTGNIESISLSESGSDYGDSEVMNYNRQPVITLINGKNAQLTPLVSSAGEIIDVVINNSGEGYNSVPTIEVDGDGSGAILTPIIVDGRVTSVKIINNGFGYKRTNTYLRVIETGSGAKFEAKIKTWNINLVQRLLLSGQISADDGVLALGLASNKEIEYCHAFSPRELRRKLLSTSVDVDGSLLYRADIFNETNTQKYHSPIVGWAYDGHPIYGPYGYANREGGAVRRLQTGYELRVDVSGIRPPSFASGTFVEDYVFISGGDLDEHNGRFCKTPEFPNGTYAYFLTIDSAQEVAGPFAGYLKPVFPYIIGPTFKGSSNRYNFSQFSSLDFVDINTTDWTRYTSNYSIRGKNSRYTGFIQPNVFSEGFTEVVSTTAGSVDSLNIIAPGDNYAIGDNIFFNNEGTSGSGVYARIESIQGKEVDTINSSVYENSQVQFTPVLGKGRYIGIGSTPHNYSVGDIVSIQNLNILATEFAKTYSVGISTNRLTLASDLPATSVTGITTYVNVTGTLTFPTIAVDDIYESNNEQVRILSIDSKNSRVRIRRNITGLATETSHLSGSFLDEKPRKFIINTGYTTTTQYKLDRILHFEPEESVGLISENLVLYSDPVSLSASTWGKTEVANGIGTVTYYADKTPDGNIAAAKVGIATTVSATDTFVLENGVFTLSGNIHTVSAFLKGENGGEEVWMILRDTAVNVYYHQKITLTREWKRYKFTATTNANPHKVGFGANGVAVGSGTTIRATLNSTPTFYVCGVQVEQSEFMSPYLPTYDTQILSSAKKVGKTYLQNAGGSVDRFTPVPNAFYIPGHGLLTGEKIIYNVGAGSSGPAVSVGSTNYWLTDNTELYAAVYNDEFVGISTNKIGIGSTGTFVGVGTDDVGVLDIDSFGSGTEHSFKTTYNEIITGDIIKKTATVATASTHGLIDGDIIDLKVLSGIQTTFIVKYDDGNRRLLINPVSFASTDVNVANNSLYIQNHGFRMGEKVIHNSSNPAGGLDDSAIYYIIVIDENTIKLSDLFYDELSSDKDISIIDIVTPEAGRLSPINPEIQAFRNNTVIFDLSDSSLANSGFPAFEFDVYTDKSCTDPFFTVDENVGISSIVLDFQVTKEGIIGQQNAKLSLIIDEKTPASLYYNVKPLRNAGASSSKVEAFSDDFNVLNPNRLTIVGSKFDSNVRISGVTTNTFDYTIIDTPEVSSYDARLGEAIIKYNTTSTFARGPVGDISLDSKGFGYKSLPYLDKVVSVAGTGALFLPRSTSIGQLSEVVLTDIGFDYPADNTLRPAAALPATYKIEPLSKFSLIRVKDPGTNYFLAPDIVVVDGFTGRVNTEAFLRYDVGDTEVEIVRNTTGLYNVTPVLMPVNNPNGTRIDNIVFDSNSGDVVVSFAVTFTSVEDYPYQIGKRIIVENTNTQTALPGRGFNSSAYEYKLFTLTDVDANIGGDFPTITYNIKNDLLPGEDPGQFDSFDSFGTVTPEIYFPIFEVFLEKDSFKKGEFITAQDNNTGVVQEYDAKNEFLKVRSKDQFNKGDVIIGQSSQNQGLISSVDGIRGEYKISSNSITKKGWKKDTGKLNQFFQRMHDNEYYQYFSYSVRSPISLEKWDHLVSNLNHTSGYKKFAELIADSYDPSIVGMGTGQDLNAFIAVSDLTSIVDLNSVQDFDTAREKAITVSNKLVSNEILFGLPFLAKYQEFIGNRVLAIDDFSVDFDGNRRDFELFCDGAPIFEQTFNGSDDTIVDLSEESVNLGNHYFVSGEEIDYIPPNNDFANAIDIVATDFGPGIGTTTKLPGSFHVIKLDNQRIQVAASATDSLRFNPVVVGFNSVGIGNTHKFRGKSPNNRLLVTVNGTIQSPIVSTANTLATGSATVGVGSTQIGVTGITSIFSGDLVKVEDEIMLVAGVDKPNNLLTIRRGWMGTTDASHSAFSTITKYTGNYNIVNNDIHFSEGMWGDIPVGLGTTATSSNNIDYTGLTTSSRFSGRVFLRSSINEAFTTSFVKAYNENVVFDDLSSKFNGITTSFILQSDGNDITTLDAGNAIVLIDDIFQGPQRLGNQVTTIPGDYKIEKTNSNTQTLLGFNGGVSDYSENNDINVNNIPRGGIIVSVGSTDGYGFQPLVAAGGTAVVSSAGTITAVAIGLTGSGYRSGLQTVGVAIQTRSVGIASYTYVGNATVNGGHVTDVVVDKVARFYKPRNIINVGYSSITGITTVQTTQKHGLGLGEEITIVGAAFTCDYYPPLSIINATYNNTTGIMTVTTGISSVNVANFVYTNTTGIGTITTATPHGLVKQTAIGRTFALAGIAMTCVGYGQTFAVHSAQYDHTTGIATIFTVGNHGLTATDDVKLRELNFTCPVGGAEGYGQQFGINNFTYDNITGLCTVTTATSISGVIGVGSEVRLDNIGLNCAFGNSVYPDGSQGYTFTVLSQPASNNFTFNAGISTLAHTYVSGGTVNAGLTTSIFPDGSQGYSFKTIGVAATSFTANVGVSSIRHTWNAGGVVQTGITTDIFPGDAQNSPTGDTFQLISAPNANTLVFNAGISTIPSTYVSGGSVLLGHRMKVGAEIALTGLGMTCGMSTEVHTYPRNRDTITDTSVAIIADGTEHTVSNVAYNPTTGVMTLTSNAHGFHNGDKIKLAEKSLTFTCDKDNNLTTHSYPRKSDPLYNRWVGIANTTVNTFKIQVLDSIPSSNTDAHTFVSATANGLTHNTGNITLNVGPSGPKHQFTHTFDGTDTFTPTAVAYNPVTGVMTLTIDNHPFRNGDFVGIAQSALTFTCAQDSHGSNHAYPRATDPIINKWIAATNITTNTFDVQVLDTVPSTNVGVHTFVSATTGGISRSVLHTGGVYNHLFVGADNNSVSVAGTNTRYTPTNAQYTASNGSLVLTIPGHNLSGAATTTATAATYDGSVGIMTVTVPGHSIANGDYIKFIDESFTFKCELDSYATDHKYPRSADPAGTSWLKVSNVGSNNFEVNVLETIPSTNTGIHSFVSATSNGILHAQSMIGIATESIKLSCDMDGHGSEHSYPRSTDPIYTKDIGVASTTADTITVDVGISTIIPYGVSSATYDPASGNLVLGIGTHSLNKGTTVKVATGSLVFTCSQDSNATKHRYPRAGDPTYAGTTVSRINSNTEFEINVGVANVPTYYKSGGYVEEIILAPRANNNSPTGQDVAFDGTAVTNIIDEYTFECDSGASPYPHFYKRAGEVTQDIKVRFDSPLGYENIPLLYSDDSKVGFGTGATADLRVSNVSGVADFEITDFGYNYGTDDILTVAIGGTVGIPTFATKTTNSVKPVVSGGRYPHTFVGAASSAVISGGGYDHTWVSSLTNGVSVTGVGNFTPTDATYNPTTGDMVLTIAGHPYTTSQTVGFTTGAITFKCLMDDDATLHSYPRPGDPVLGYGVTAITAKDTNTITVNVGASTTVGYSVDNATYNPETGEMVLTIPSHGLKGSEDYTVTHALYNAGTGGMTLTLSGITTLNALNVGDRVKFDDNSINFTCTLDPNAAAKSYPRATDPSSGKWLPVVGVATDNIEVLVGASATVYYTPVGAEYNSSTGYMTLAIGEHDLKIGEPILIANNSINFQCSQDNYATAHQYPRAGTDPIAGIGTPITGVGDTSITLFVGIGTDSDHRFIAGLSSATNAVRSGGNYPHTFASATSNGLKKAGESIRLTEDALTFKCEMDDYATEHTYPRSNKNKHRFVRTTAGSILPNVGTALTPTAADYDGNTGNLILSFPEHNLTAGSNTVGIATGGIIFTCELDDHRTEHAYPRTTDFAHNATIGIAGTTLTTITINVGKSGITTSDPMYKNAVSVGSTTENTITLNIGKAPSEKRFKVENATYDGFTGWMTLTVGQHSLHTGDIVRLANESILFSCSSDDYGSINPYPRKTDPIYGGVGIASTTPTTIRMNVGMAPVGKRYAHQFVGIGSYKEFQLTVDETYASKFSGWNVGDFLVLDDITAFFNGDRRLFPLALNGDRISFFARANAGINLQSNLLVFVNDVLQTPGEGYTFTGGSTLRFTEAPKGGVAGFTTTGDKCKLLMYTGTQSIDVKTVDVLPTVKVGDDVQLYSDIDVTFSQEERLVMDVKSADTIITNNYAGQGVTPDELLARPISWSKQSIDKIIDNKFISKDRVYYEPIINPQSNILENIGVNSTSAFVWSVRSLFDDPKEAMLVLDSEKVQILSQEESIDARATTIIGSGAVQSVNITSGGIGYTAAPTVSIQKPFNEVLSTNGATATASITAGIVTAITVGSGGTGYLYGPLTSLAINQQGIGFPFLENGTNTFENAKLKSKTGMGRGATANIEINTVNYQIGSVAVVEGGTGYQPGDVLYVDTYDNVGLGTTNRRWALSQDMQFTVGAISGPEVMIAPPSRKIEESPKATYEGDYGIIVGVGTTSIAGVASTGITFDLYIPQNSKLKSGFSLVQSGIQTGYLFNIIGSGVNGTVTTLRGDNSVLGIGTTCMDATYEVADYSHTTRFIPSEISGASVGIATTVTTVIAKISSFDNVVGFGTTSFYGSYTWGKVNFTVRMSNKQAFEAVNGTSQSGIGSNPVIKRRNPLKYDGYIT